MQMKNMVTLIILLCIFEFILGEDCFSDNRPSNAGDCQKRTVNNKAYCCYVEYHTVKTFKNENYDKLCVDVLKSDVDDGMFEEVMKTIESASYTSMGWSRHQLNYFKTYSTIKNFDCKSNYLAVSLILLLLFML